MAGQGSLIFALAGLLALLAGCGGGGAASGSGGGGGSRAPLDDPRIGRLDAYEAQKLRVLGNPSIGAAALPVTAPGDMPVAGTASFVGSATIRVEVPGNPVVLYGDADVAVDFQTGATTATLGGFFGGPAQQAVGDYQGIITATGTQVRQDMTLDYTGTLTRGQSNLTFGGEMAAVFLDTPVTALVASDLDAVVNVDGTGQDATLIVISEGAVVPPSQTPP